MSDKKISQLTAATTPLAGTEVLPIVQSGVTKQVSVNNLTAGRDVSAKSLSLTTTPLSIASGGSNATTYTAPDGYANSGILYYDGSKFSTDPTLNNFCYSPTYSQLSVKNLYVENSLFTSGNVGVSTSVSTWNVNTKALELPSGSLNSYLTSQLYQNQNAYTNASLVWTYKNTGYASQYIQYNGIHQWNTAPSGTTGDPISFTTGMTLDASNNLTVNAGNLIIGTSGKGIDFSATASGSGTMTSELLADYEEGTWTPTLTSSGATFSYGAQYGSYTKIGRQVTATFRFYVSASGTLTNYVTISDLPFVPSSTYGMTYGGYVIFSNTTITPLIQISPSDANAYLTVEGTGADATPSSLGMSGVNKWLNGVITYFV